MQTSSSSSSSSSSSRSSSSSSSAGPQRRPEEEGYGGSIVVCDLDRPAGWTDEQLHSDPMYSTIDAELIARLLEVYDYDQRVRAVTKLRTGAILCCGVVVTRPKAIGESLSDEGRVWYVN